MKAMGESRTKEPAEAAPAEVAKAASGAYTKTHVNALRLFHQGDRKNSILLANPSMLIDFAMKVGPTTF